MLILLLLNLQVLDALLNNLQETLELATSRGEGAGPESKVPAKCALLFDAFRQHYLLCDLLAF